MTDHTDFMRLALALARRGYGATSPNPMVGAVLVKNGHILGRGWHRGAGLPHAEIEALRDAESHGRAVRGATLYVTLEPCCTFGRTPPCTDAIREAGIRDLFVGAPDPNPAHSGKGIRLLQRAGIRAVTGVLAREACTLNEAFNHWIVHRTPFVTVKSAMTLDGKIATAQGESKWITGEKSRACAMKLRRGADAVLAGINTILIDDPQLTWRPSGPAKPPAIPRLRRIILDPMARLPLTAKVANDDLAHLTTAIVSRVAPKGRVAALGKKIQVHIAPDSLGKIDLHWLLKRLGSENVLSLLVEGGGETNATFFEQRLADRIVFFYAPKILGGSRARKGVAGNGARSWEEVLSIEEPQWRQLGPDLLLSARVVKTARFETER